MNEEQYKDIKIITVYNGHKHIAQFNHRSNSWRILGSDEYVFNEQVVKIEEAMQ